MGRVRAPSALDPPRTRGVASAGSSSRGHCMIDIIPAALALGLAASSTLAAEVEKTLPFVADNYPKALAEARAQRLALFIEAWAPWWQTCRSMRAFVLTDL